MSPSSDRKKIGIQLRVNDVTKAYSDVYPEGDRYYEGVVSVTGVLHLTVGDTVTVNVAHGDRILVRNKNTPTPIFTGFLIAADN